MTATGISKRGKTKPPKVSKPAKTLRPRAADGLFASWLSGSSRVNGVRPPDAETSLHFSGLLDQFPAPLVESMRYLVGRFQLGEKVELPRRLGVISALHGEGVTTISRTLSAVIAHDLDVRVCWVDFSWPSPQSPQAPEPQGPAGIYEILSGGMGLASALQKTEDSRLMILRAGRIPNAQREQLVRSPLLGKLVDDLEKQFDCVVFDMPPILAGSAGLGLVRHTDSYLLVVRHGVTTTQQVRAVADELRGVPSIGVVLNRFNSRIPKWLAHFVSS